MATIHEIIDWIEKLTGQKVPFSSNIEKLHEHDPFINGGIELSQFNELLLTLGYDRINENFFTFLFGENRVVKSFSELTAGIDKFRKVAMLLYGNIKFAFKKFSQISKDDLGKILKQLKTLDAKKYEERCDPLHIIEQIDPEEAYYLGYIVERELKEKMKSELDPEINKQLEKQLKRMEQIRQVGRKNHEAYLTYDHMDVYIATSMRERHEFVWVSGFIKELFNDDELKTLKLRWFDPTQAYCDDRIDKGLVEGLMIKRAKCTIYHVQESDTLGKDSELAATLAQGKPVIAYVPHFSDINDFKKGILQMFRKCYGNDSVIGSYRSFLRRFCNVKDRDDPDIKRCFEDVNVTENYILDILYDKIYTLYEKRAKSLTDSHPLALQMNIHTGIANGILVVRKVKDCARLLRNILLNQMEFEIEEKYNETGKLTHICLKEKISGCIYRVVTTDELLTNSFWNFYLK